MIAYWKIRARLLGVPGVANVAIWGERQQMLQVQVDPERLAANGVTLDQVMKATADALDAGLSSTRAVPWSAPAGSSTPRTSDSGSVTSCPSLTPDDLAQVVVEADGRPAAAAGRRGRRGDGHQPLIGDAVINDGPGLHADRREAALGQHAGRDPRASKRRWRR